MRYLDQIDLVEHLWFAAVTALSLFAVLGGPFLIALIVLNIKAETRFMSEYERRQKEEEI